LAEEYEARPPRIVARISGVHQRYDKNVMLKLHWDGRINDRVCGLRGMAPWRGVRVAALTCNGSRYSTWHTVGDNDAVHGWLLLSPLSVGGGVVLCCVLLAYVVCVEFALACYV
jgi:hypothetical protein